MNTQTSNTAKHTVIFDVTESTSGVEWVNISYDQNGAIDILGTREGRTWTVYGGDRDKYQASGSSLPIALKRLAKEIGVSGTAEVRWEYRGDLLNIIDLATGKPVEPVTEVTESAEAETFVPTHRVTWYSPDSADRVSYESVILVSENITRTYGAPYGVARVIGEDGTERAITINRYNAIDVTPLEVVAEQQIALDKVRAIQALKSGDRVRNTESGALGTVENVYDAPICDGGGKTLGVRYDSGERYEFGVSRGYIEPANDNQPTHVVTFLDGTTERVTVTSSTYEPDASYGAVGTVTARTVNGVSRTYRFGPSGDGYSLETVGEYGTRTDPATDQEIAEALAILRNGAVESHKTSIRKMVAFELDKRKLAVYGDAGSDTWWTLSLWTPEDSYDTPSSEEFLTTDNKIVLVYDVDLYALNSRVQYADESDGYESVFDLSPLKYAVKHEYSLESAHVIGTCAVCDYTGNVTKAFDTTLCEPCHVHCMLIRQRASKSQQESADQETPSSEEFVTDDGEILTVLSVNPQTHMARVAGWAGTFLREVPVWDLTPERLQEYSLDMLSAGGENNAAMRQAQTEEMRATSQAREASGLELEGWERELLASYDQESADEKRKRELRYLQRGLISSAEYREEIARIDSQESAKSDMDGMNPFWYH